MGEMAEYYEYNDDIVPPFRPMWKRRDGSFVAISSMNDHHLVNAVRMLMRKKMTFDTTYCNLVAEVKRRGLMKEMG